MRNSLKIAVFVVFAGLLAGCGDDGPVRTSGPPSLAALLDSTVINLEQWSIEDGGNDHYYGVIPLELYQDEMADLIASFEVSPWTAGLATLTSAEENSFILDNVVAGTNQPSILDEFWIGAHYVDGEWAWSTGEVFGYTNWAIGEPNNIGIETASAMWGPNNTQSNRTPGTWNNALPDDLVNPLSKLWAVVEFEE